MEFRELEGQDPRVETGPVRFGNDWTGLFIRGDDCAGLLAAIDVLEPSEFFQGIAVKQLKELLSSPLPKRLTDALPSKQVDNESK